MSRGPLNLPFRYQMTPEMKAFFDIVKTARDIQLENRRAATTSNDLVRRFKTAERALDAALFQLADTYLEPDLPPIAPVAMGALVQAIKPKLVGPEGQSNDQDEAK